MRKIIGYVLGIVGIFTIILTTPDILLSAVAIMLITIGTLLLSD